MKNDQKWRFFCLLINAPLTVGAIAYVVYKLKYDNPMLKNVGPSVIYAGELLALTAVTILANVFMWVYSRKSHDRNKFSRRVSLTSFIFVIVALWIGAKAVH